MSPGRTRRTSRWTRRTARSRSSTRRRASWPSPRSPSWTPTSSARAPGRWRRPTSISSSATPANASSPHITTGRSSPCPTSRRSPPSSAFRSPPSPRTGTMPWHGSSPTAPSSTASTAPGSARRDRHQPPRAAGLSLSLGYTLFYVGVLVLVPVAAGALRASALTAAELWAAVSTPRAIAAYALTLGASLAAALIDAALGTLVAWVLVRYRHPLTQLLDALVDIPFALPTAVAGLVYADLYADKGWFGQYLAPLGIRGAYSRLGIVLVLIFVGFPFVVRTLQPVLEDLDPAVEEAAACLGASRPQTLALVLAPALVPAVVSGFGLAFARALGEYGSVVFIAGNMPFRTEIAPVLIVARLEEFEYGEAN